MDAATNVFQYGIAPAMIAASRTRVASYYRSGGWVSGHWRTTASGARTFVAPHYRSGGMVSGHTRGNAASSRLALARRWVGRGGLIFSGMAGGADQLVEDAGRRGLSTTDRVGRTAAVAGASTVLSWGGGVAGAAAGGAAGAKVGAGVGALVGSVIPGAGTGVGAAAGTAIGGTIGAVAGGIAGSGLGSWAADEFSDNIAPVGEAVANGTVDAWNATEGVRDKISEGLDKINPF
ncbi:MAG: hypothetical protein M3N16_05765 [Actinomycetota bacterium]|nr:hypothetical protein [Actinomycetota bacterium]